MKNKLIITAAVLVSFACVSTYPEQSIDKRSGIEVNKKEIEASEEIEKRRVTMLSVLQKIGTLCASFCVTSEGDINPGIRCFGPH